MKITPPCGEIQILKNMWCIVPHERHGLKKCHPVISEIGVAGPPSLPPPLGHIVKISLQLYVGVYHLKSAVDVLRR